MACYIDGAFAAALGFLHKYASDAPGAATACLLASVNAGGENVARSAVLGMALGAVYGPDAWAGPWWSGLKDAAAIEAEILAASTAP